MGAPAQWKPQNATVTVSNHYSFFSNTSLIFDKQRTEHFETVDCISSRPEFEVRLDITQPEPEHLVELGRRQGHLDAVHLSQDLEALAQLRMSGCRRTNLLDV